MKLQENQASGILYVVATPIGNLQDITLRALSILKEVDLILCEDTRKSRVLLTRFGISSRLVSFHKFSESKKTQFVMSELEAGRNLAIISDAGTPAISDPGHRLIQALRGKAFQIISIPGASSVISALSISGFDCSNFVFLGYAPKKATLREAFFQNLTKETRTIIFFETPHRLLETLEIGSQIMVDRQLFIGKELTKLHEEIFVGTFQELFRIFSGKASIRGEYILVLENYSGQDTTINEDELIADLMGEGFSGKDLVSEAHRKYGISRTKAYQTYLKLRKIGPDTQE
jgi:16S rRNA (cytidine1402-2'-O)-methyltransferase